MIAGSPVSAKISVASPYDLKVGKGFRDHLGGESHLVIRCLPIGVTSLHEQIIQLGASDSETIRRQAAAGNEIERPQHVDRTIDLRFGSLNDQVGRRLFCLQPVRGKQRFLTLLTFDSTKSTHRAKHCY